MAGGRKITRSSQRGQWFSVYKPTQGYWTRLCTAVGAGTFVLWGAHWLFQKLEVYTTTQTGQLIQIGIPVLWIVIWGLALYWVLGRKAGTVDFFIAVEGEMKKVNWSTKQEVLGATKIVMMFVMLVGVMLFLVDAMFMLFFWSINVLKLGDMGDFIRSVFGGGG